MHLVGFIIRIYHDARSPEREIRQDITEFYILWMCDVVLYPTFCILRSSILVTANEKMGEDRKKLSGSGSPEGVPGPYVAFFWVVVSWWYH